MYKPTLEKFELKVDTYLNDDNIKIFACICDNNVLGVMVLSFDEDNNAEIIGIAVAKEAIILSRRSVQHFTQKRPS